MKFLPPILFGCLVLGLALRVPAQEPPPRPVGPITRPPAAPHHDAASPDSRDIALADIFEQYSRLTGKRVTTNNTVNPAAPCTLADLDGTSPPQRISLIERTLFLSSYTLADADADTIVVLGPGKNPRTFGLPLYTKPEEIPSGERVFSSLCRLEHREALETEAILQQFIPQTGVTNFTADAKSHTVIAAAPMSIMHTVLHVVAALDADNGNAAR